MKLGYAFGDILKELCPSIIAETLDARFYEDTSQYNTSNMMINLKLCQSSCVAFSRHLLAGSIKSLIESHLDLIHCVNTSSEKVAITHLKLGSGIFGGNGVYAFNGESRVSQLIDVEESSKGQVRVIVYQSVFPLISFLHCSH